MPLIEIIAVDLFKIKEICEEENSGLTRNSL